MNKKILIGTVAILSSASIYAAAKSFNIDSSKLSFSSESKSEAVAESFDSNYNLTYKIESENEELKKNITELTKKTTFLLFGDFNLENESAEQYYNRYNEYLSLRYDPEVPKKEGTFTGLDEDSEEYKDDLVSGMTLPGIFLAIDEKGVKYDSFGDIKVSVSNDMVISSITLPNVQIKQESKTNPMEYEYVKSNIVMYYYFKEIRGEYKLYYLMGEVTDDLSEYFDQIESNEKKDSYAIAPTYNSGLKDIYNFSKLEALTEQDISNIYNKVSENIVTINAYYDSYVVANANGIIINDGIVVTTWNFMEKALINSQFIALSDSKGNSLVLDGIVTANPETNIVVLKLKDKVQSNISLAKLDTINVEDAAITLTSKTGIGLNVLSGIVISKDGLIQTTIPLTDTDSGSPLINSNGDVIGMNASQNSNSSISSAIPADALEEVKNKFNGIDFNTINTISFESLKEKYYYISFNDETVSKDVSDKVWKKYSKIGKLEENIKFKLVKANYVDGVFSVRYQNEVADYIDTMQFIYSYREELEAEGYNNVLDSNSKCIYENNKNRVIIMSEMDYLVIVMVKK